MIVAEAQTSKRRTWRSVVFSTAVVTIAVGLAPLSYLVWWGKAHHLEPLSIPIPLKHGEFTSPVFTTELDEDYQIGVYFVPPHRVALDLDWKVVDETGKLISGGNYAEGQQLGGKASLSTGIITQSPDHAKESR